MYIFLFLMQFWEPGCPHVQLHQPSPERKITAGHWPISDHLSKMANQNFSMVHSLCTHGQSNSSRIGNMADHFKFLILHSASLQVLSSSALNSCQSVMHCGTTLLVVVAAVMHWRVICRSKCVRLRHRESSVHDVTFSNSLCYAFYADVINVNVSGFNHRAPNLYLEEECWMPHRNLETS